MPAVAAGLHVKVDVDNFAREQALVAKAEAVGVEVTPLSNFWLADSEVPVDKRGGWCWALQRFRRWRLPRR